MQSSKSLELLDQICEEFEEMLGRGRVQVYPRI